MLDVLWITAPRLLWSGNLGGRQVDGVPATMCVLPEIVAAVEGRSEGLGDSGIRRGTDVVKSVVLGGPVRFSAGGRMRMDWLLPERLASLAPLKSCPPISIER